MGSDFSHFRVVWFWPIFQSTLPVWGATILQTLCSGGLNISIHAPRVGSDNINPPKFYTAKYFNPRSPCGERRPRWSARTPTRRFQSTLPVWGATACIACTFHNRAISIHAPRVGSDAAAREKPRKAAYFNPRSPCGERRRLAASTETPCLFQSTLPVWGATSGGYDEKHPANRISIHAPRVGSDKHYRLYAARQCDFNPRSPCGERPSTRPWPPRPGYFNPRSPCGERHNLVIADPGKLPFQSTLPVWGATRLRR